MKREQIEKGIAAIFEETGIAKAARENNFAEYLQDAMMRLVEWAFTSHKVLNVPDTKRDEIIKQLANYKLTLIIGEPISPWISVEERLPEPEKEVIILAKNKYIDIDHLTDDGEGGYYWWKSDEWICCEDDKITHWMPIPELPKEE